MTVNKPPEKSLFALDFVEVDEACVVVVPVPAPVVTPCVVPVTVAFPVVIPCVAVAPSVPLVAGDVTVAATCA